MTAAFEDVSSLKKLYKKILKNIKYNQRILELKINQKRKKESQLKKGDEIYISIKNLRVMRKSKKLDH